jgi:outer membrane protein OmpA-like peptidoglycan-associated protein
VRITDVLARQLELQVDEVGAFRFENVPPGAATITISAPGYLKSVIHLNVEALQELDQRFPLAPVPTKPGIKLNKQQLDLTSPIVFAEGSAKLSRDALFTIQELAPFLDAHPEITHVEVQSHTADTGPAGTTLSNDRANAIRDALVLHGVSAARITARGYGGSVPLVPADNPAHHKNERIVFKVEAGPEAAKPSPDAPKPGAAAAKPSQPVAIPGLDLPKAEPVAPKPVPTPPKL